MTRFHRVRESNPDKPLPEIIDETIEDSRLLKRLITLEYRGVELVISGVSNRDDLMRRYMQRARKALRAA
jgi:hypothetical protein